MAKTGYQPEVYLAKVTVNTKLIEYVEAVTLGLTNGATLSVIIAGANCKALIHTGVSCS